MALSTLGRSGETSTPYFNDGFRAGVHAFGATLERIDNRLNTVDHSVSDLLSWMLSVRPVLREGSLFDLQDHAYLKDIYADNSERMVLCKAGQMGLSEYALSRAIYSCAVLKATTLYLFPTDAHVSDFSTERLGPAIEVSDRLADLVVSANAIGKRGADRIKLMRFGDRFLYFRGGKVDPKGNAAQLKSVAADVLILDEIDEMDRRAPSIAEKRLGHSKLGHILALSTPTYAGTGIHDRFLGSSQKVWTLKCGGCNADNVIGIDHIVTEFDALDRPVGWNGMGEGRAFAGCKKCGKELDRRGEGFWVTSYPDHAVTGYHIPKFCSPTADFLQIVRALQSTDETVLRESTNQDLGLPYTPKGGGVTDETLQAAERDYALGKPKRATRCYLGCDVGKLLHVVIRAAADPETGERRMIYVAELETFEDLGNVIREFKPVVSVIDAQPEQREARKLQARLRQTVYLCYYQDDTKYEDINRFNSDEGVVNTDRTRSIDEMLTRLREGVNVHPGTLRQNDTYANMMKASPRVMEDKRDGSKVARYVKLAPDHFFHAENYCSIASFGMPTTGHVRAPAGKVTGVRK